MRKYRGMLPVRNEIIGYRKSGAPIYAVRGASSDLDPLEELAQAQAKRIERMGEIDEALARATAEKTDTPEKVEARSNKLTELKTEWDKLQGEFDADEAREAEIKAGVEERKARQSRLEQSRAKLGSIQVGARVGAPEENYSVELRTIGQPGSQATMTKRAQRILDDNDIAGHLRSEQKEKITKLLRQQSGDVEGGLIGALMIATSNPHYRSAFQKAVSSSNPAFTPDEARAINEVSYVKRAMAIGASGTGGFAVPVVIDPTIILTSQGTSNDLLRLARVETITTDRWRGLSSAGVSWKFDAEAAASTDNSPTIAKPEVPTVRADGFIPYSIEVGMDWPGFANDMSELLASGYDELLADKLTTATGANLPVGLIPALVSQTAPDVSTATATAGTIAPADVYALWGRLPQRHRRKASTAFMSSTDVQSAVRQLGTLDPNFSIDITQEAIPRLFGREYPMNDYMDSTKVGTAAGNLAVVGDFRGFLVAQRAGMNIEFVPMLFDVTNNRPTGQRGWFAWARVGSGVVDPTAFQLLQNKTS